MRDFANCFESVVLNPGEEVVAANSNSDHWYIVEQGLLDVFSPATSPCSQSNTANICIGVLGPGNSFNAEAMLFGRNSDVSVRAALRRDKGNTPQSHIPHLIANSGDTVRVLRLKRSALEQLTVAHGGFELNMPMRSASQALIDSVFASHPMFARVRIKEAHGDTAFKRHAMQSFYRLDFKAGDTIISQGTNFGWLIALVVRQFDARS
jgi:CRP-like cAMP-binding protein